MIHVIRLSNGHRVAISELENSLTLSYVDAADELWHLVQVFDNKVSVTAHVSEIADTLLECLRTTSGSESEVYSGECPSCRSNKDVVERDGFHRSEDNPLAATMPCHCTECGAKWTEVLQVTSIADEVGSE